MTNQKLLSEKIRLCGFNVEILAKKIGLSRAGLYKKINNENEFRVSEIIKISRLLNLSTEERENIFFVESVDYMTTKTS